MLSEYQTELRSFYGPDARGARKLAALLQGLPLGSAVHRAEMPESWWWTHNEELLALIVESIDTSNRMFMAAHTNNTVNLPPPVQIARPWKQEPAPQLESSPGSPAPAGRRQSTASEVKTFLDGGSIRVDRKES